MKAPLLIGCDVSNMSSDTLRILTNTEVIAINQDKMGIQGSKKKSENDLEVWAGPLEGGCFAVVLLNRGNSTADVTANWSDIGMDATKQATVRDLWQKKDMGTMTGSVKASVPSHGVAMYKITPTS